MIYFISDAATGHVKIGFSEDPWRRLSQIQSHCPGALTLRAIVEGDEAAEAELHARFAEYSVRGEWFRAAGAVADHIMTLPKAQPPARYVKTTSFWNGLNGSQVARLVGVHKSFISEVRTGKRRPSPELAIKLQRATGVSAIRLVFGDLAGEAA